MPLGKTPILQTDLMAEGDTNKHILFNDAVQKLEDAINREVVVDLAAADVTLTETQILGYGVIRFVNGASARTVTIPATIAAGVHNTNRILILRNAGTAPITVTHDNAGIDVAVPAGDTGIIYANGTDIVSLGGVAAAEPRPVQKDSAQVVADHAILDFIGTGVTVADAGAGVVSVTINNAFTGLVDTPANYTGSAGLPVVVNGAGDGLAFGVWPQGYFLGTYATLTALETAHPAPATGSYGHVDGGVGSDVTMYIWDADDSIYVAASGSGSETEASIKTKYEANANTNAFTDTEKAKLEGVESGATADQTGTEIVAAINTELGGSAWQSGSAGVSITTQAASFTLSDGQLAGNQVIKTNNASPNTVTVPSGLTGTQPVIIIQMGAGQTTIAAGAGVTINSAGGLLALRAQWSSATLIPDGTDTFILIGDLA